MSSRIWVNGNEAVAVANIVADALAQFFIVDDGRQVLDMSKVNEYLRTKFRSLATDEGEVPGSTHDNMTKSVSIYTLSSALEMAIGLAALEQRPGYPSTAKITLASVAAAVVAGRAKTDARAADVTAMYSWTQGEALTDYVRSYFREAGREEAIPQGEAREVDTRSYRCVYRTDIGELSKPSDVSALVDLDQNDTASLTAAAPPAGRFIDTVLWYRSNTGNASGAIQYFGELAVGVGLTYTDSVQAAALGEALQSIEWDEPPANLRGIRMHPGNFGVGFFDNTICPSVAARLYAWPITYRKTTAKPIVGIEVGGTTVFVGTQGEPVLLTGSDPAFLSAERVQGGQPCRSARSIVATSRGFMYAGAAGIALCAGLQETPIITRQHFTKEQWEALKPESIFAVEYDGCYIFWWNNGVTSGCYSLGIETGRLATLDVPAAAAFVNSSNGRLYAVSGTQIVEVFGGAARRTGLWKSPRIAGNSSAAWLRVSSDYEAGNLTVRWTRHIAGHDPEVKAYVAANRREQRVHPAPASMDEYEIELEGQSAASVLLLTDSSGGLK